MHAFTDELTRRGMKAVIVQDSESKESQLEVFHGEEVDFVYSVHVSEYLMPNDALVGKPLADVNDGDKYYRAEVHLQEGGQGYDVMGWTSEQLISDMLDQYERHLHYLHMVR